MSSEKNIELVVSYINGGMNDIFTLVKYNAYDSRPEIWQHDGVIEFKYVAMGKIRTKIIPLSAIKSAEIYEE